MSSQEDRLFAGPGEARRLCREVEWSSTSLGPPARWPASLRVAVMLCLDAKTPMAVWAGAELRLIHNDAYGPLLGARYPGATGKTLREVWPEVADELEPRFRQLIATGVGRRESEGHYRLYRNGHPEEGYFTFSQTPIRDPGGPVVGILTVGDEVTSTVRSRNETEALLRFALTAGEMAAFDMELSAERTLRAFEHAKLFRYESEPANWSYQTFLEHVVPEDRAKIDARFTAAVTRRANLDCECRVIRRDGERRWLSVCGRQRTNDHGAAHLVGIVQDITDRKRAEAERDTDDARRAFFLSLSDALRPPGDPQHIEAEACRLLAAQLGADRVYYCELDWKEQRARIRADHPKNGQRSVAGTWAIGDLSDAFAALRRGEPAFVDDIAKMGRLTPGARAFSQAMGIKAWGAMPLVRREHPSWALIVTSSRPRAWTKEEIALIAEVADRTWAAVKLAAATEELRESERRYRTLFETMDEGFVVLELVRDPKGRAVDFRWAMCNRAFEELTGLTREGVLGRLASEVLPADYGWWLRTYSEVANSGRVCRFEHSVASMARTWDLTAFPYGTDRVAVLYDEVTERKRDEEALRAANERLLESDRRKTEFLAMLSHELRNPLTPIKNSLFVLDRAPPGGEQARRALEVIERQTRQLARLVDDLLDMTRITRNKIELQRRRLDLNQVVARTVEDHHSLFERTGVALETLAARHPVWVDGDENRIAQIIGNLLQNSAKFTSRGGVTRVRVESDLAGRRGVIRVTDNGVGIDPQMLDRVFQPFEQADKALDRSKGGLGLGLTLVKGLVELHGGEVAVHSEGVGRGAEFVVRLPLAVPLAESTQAQEPAPHVTRRRVLIIEDNVDAAESLAEVLAFSDNEVAVAHDGPEGLALAPRFHPDVVLCDIGLPGMDGYEVARTLRRMPELEQTPLVALTGYAQPDDQRRAREAGFTGHLAKPPDLGKLERLLAGLPAPRPGAQSLTVH